MREPGATEEEMPRIRETDGGVNTLVLTHGDTLVEVDPVMGGRLMGLSVAGRQLLLDARAQTDPVIGGCFPMVPWAGRVRDGRFTLDGHDVQLERDAPPNALHGLAYRRPWTVQSTSATQAQLDIDLSTPAMVAAGWPFGGQVSHTVTALPDGVHATMRVTAGPRSLPLVMGWHPWFVRHVDGVGGQAMFAATAMLQRGADGLPTGRRVPVSEGPWDDCMVGLQGTPAVAWPGLGRLEVDSDLDHLVVFDEHPDAICIEPQSGPPDAFNHDPPPMVEPTATAQAWMTLRWLDHR